MLKATTHAKACRPGINPNSDLFPVAGLSGGRKYMTGRQCYRLTSTDCRNVTAGRTGSRPAERASHDFDDRGPRSHVDVVDRREWRCASRDAVELNRSEAEVEHGIGAIVVDYDRVRIESRRSIDVYQVTIGETEIRYLVITEVGGGVVTEIIGVGARATRQRVVSRAPVEDVVTVTAIQLVIACAAGERVIAISARERVGSVSAV